MSQARIVKQPAGRQDLLMGEGKVVQERDGQLVEVEALSLLTVAQTKASLAFHVIDAYKVAFIVDDASFGVLKLEDLSTEVANDPASYVVPDILASDGSEGAWEITPVTPAEIIVTSDPVIATAGQTVFNFPEITTQTSAGVIPIVQGASYVSGYSVSTGQLVLDQGVPAGSEVAVRVIRSAPVGSSSIVKTALQVLDNATTVTVPEITDQTSEQVAVVLNGAVLRDGYSTSAGTLTFSSPISGDFWALIQYTTPIGTTTAGAVTDVSRGQSVQSTLAENSLSDITSLIGKTGAFDGQRVSIASYHPGWATVASNPVGGGEFVWQASRDKSDHNGGTVVSPTVPWNGLQSGLADFLDGVGETDGAGQGCWVRQCEEVSVDDFGAVGDNSTDDIAPIQKAIDTRLLEEKRTVRLSAKIYRVTTPVLIKDGINLVGAGEDQTGIKKELASTVDGVDAVMMARASDTVRDFKIKDITVTGNRTDFADGNVVSTHGVFLESANNFTIENVKARKCDHGFWFFRCYIGTIIRASAVTCQRHGFRTGGDPAGGPCTSLTFITPLTFGCGGAFLIRETIYFTILSAANDHAFSGGLPGDPFLPQGSGGQFDASGSIQSLFFISGSRGTITSSGCEFSYGRFLYAEGAFVDILAPNVVLQKCHDTDGRAIQIRGTAASQVNMTAAQLQVSNEVGASALRPFFFIENPSRQTLKLDRYIEGDSSWGNFAQPIPGVEFDVKDILVDQTQEKMVVGASPFITDPADITSTVTEVSGERRLDIVNQKTTSQKVAIPLDQGGAIEVAYSSFHTSSFALTKIRIVSRNAFDSAYATIYGGNIYDCIKVHVSSAANEPGVGVDWEDFWTLREATGAADTWAIGLDYGVVLDEHTIQGNSSSDHFFYRMNRSGDDFDAPLFLEIPLRHSSDVLYFTEFCVNQIR